MGTRNLTMVINKEGKIKVAQYGQWDGYPSGQGIIALEFLSKCNLDKFNRQLNKLRWISEDETKKVNETKDWHLKYPYLSRDAGAKILNAIHRGEITISDYPNDDKKVKVKVEYLVDSSDFAADSLFCEWAYVIDLKNNTFEVYKGFNKEVLNESERFSKTPIGEKTEYKQVKLVKKYSLSQLPTAQTFFAECNDKDEDEDQF